MNKRLWWFVVPLPFVCCALPAYILGAYYKNKLHQLENISSGDAKLQEAAKTARKSLPMFKQRLKKPQPGDRFAIRGRFKSEVGPEYLWLKNPKIEGDGFTATLDQEPALYRKVKKGDKVHVPESEVYDWLVQRADGIRAGGFTEITLGQEARQPKK